MSFRRRNALYLRISLHTVLPVYLYLDDKHTSWMTDAILQRVVADLKYLILAKWRDEEPYRSHTGPQAKKFGIVDVYRDDTYQVAYFLQKSDSHNLLIKSRYFVAKPQARFMPPPPIPYPTPNSKSETRPRKGGKPKNVKPQTKSQLKPRKRKRNDDYGEEAQDSGSGENESDGDGDDPTEPVGTRRSVRTQGSRHVAPGPYREFDESDDEDRLEDQQPGKGLAAAVNCTEECDTEMNAEQSTKERHEINVQNAIRVKAEPDEGNTLSVLSGTIPMTAGDNADQDTQMDETGNDYDHAMLIAADDEEEEEKPKPDLSLRYAGYTIPDVCLTIIVEPWSSPSRAGTREPSIVPTGPGAGINRSRFVGVVASTPAREETEPPLESTSTPASRAQTPLFREFTPMPEAGPSVSAPLRPPAPQTFGRILPRVPLFHEATPAPEDDFLPDNFDDGDEENETSSIMQFSQAMNLGSTKSSGFGNGNEGDEDDMDVFLADADEGR